MKTEDAGKTSASAKTRAIKTLKLAKETVQDLSDTHAGAIKGGQRTVSCTNTVGTSTL